MQLILADLIRTQLYHLLPQPEVEAYVKAHLDRLDLHCYWCLMMEMHLLRIHTNPVNAETRARESLSCATAQLQLELIEHLDRSKVTITSMTQATTDAAEEADIEPVNRKDDTVF